MLLFSSAYAQDASAGIPQEPSLAASMLPLLAILGIFYFMILRPQHKRAKQHQAMIQSAERGDKILTAGGIVGKVVKMDEANDLLHVQIAEGVVVEVSRPSVSVVYGKENAVSSGEKSSTSLPSKKKAGDKKPVANDN
jgi:preprotein translocase subunit YajC